MASSEVAKVLVADDEPLLLRRLARALENAGFDVHTAADGKSAAELAAGTAFDVIVSDIAMPGLTGIQLLQAVRQRDLDVPVILMTGSPELTTAIRAVEHGAMQYLVKPVELSKMVEVVSAASRLRRLGVMKRQALELVSEGGQGIADRAGLEAVFDRTLDGIWMAYQPIVRARDGSLFGYEALLRSQEPALPNPGAVLDAAERLGRLHDLGRKVRERAAAAMAQAPEHVRLFVNLHARDLLDERLTSSEAALSAIADRVVLEITERAPLDHMQDARARVARLRAMGFSIAVDDLGAGYAGLTSFATLEPEFIKLDMSLVRDVDTDPKRQTLIRSIAGLCKEMNVVSVAEGIETIEERNAIVALGCDLLQGYVLAKPGPAFPDYHW